MTMNQRAWWFLTGACAALSVPTLAFATDMPPVELLLIGPTLLIIGLTALIWFGARLMSDMTACSFTRLVLIALIWTPMPETSMGASYGIFSFSGFHLLSILTTGGQHSAYLTMETS